jgi:hypothetical protein
MADDTFGAMNDLLTMPTGIDGIPVDSPQTEDLPDLLLDTCGEGGPSRWGMDAPSFGELEPTQCFPSATAAWGSGAYGPGAALAFGAGPSETFGAFGAQHQGQIADTAGTPFHPTTIPMVSLPYGVSQMQMPIPTQMMTAPQQAQHPGGVNLPATMQVQVQAEYGRGGPTAPAGWMPATMFAPAGCPPPGFVNCGIFPNMNMAAAMTIHMQHGCHPFPPPPTSSSQQPLSMATATMSASPAVVPSVSPPQSLTCNNNGMCTNNDGSSSGDEVVPSGPSCLLRTRKPGSMSSDDSGRHHGHLQVVPENDGNGAANAINNSINNNIQVAAYPSGNGEVMVVPYNGGLMTVRRPPLDTATAAAAAALMNQHHHLSATSASTAGLSMLGVPIGSTRAASLERYRQKKASRSYSKHIRYHMRKVNADRRPRVKGRFIKASVVAEAAETLNNELDTEEVV